MWQRSCSSWLHAVGHAMQASPSHFILAAAGKDPSSSFLVSKVKPIVPHLQILGHNDIRHILHRTGANSFWA